MTAVTLYLLPVAPNSTEEAAVTKSSTTASNPAEEADAPLDRMLSLSEVCAIEGVTRWTIRRRVKDGLFPPGYELENGGIGWPESVIRARRKNRARTDTTISSLINFFIAR